jgi:hypothetical protein
MRGNPAAALAEFESCVQQCPPTQAGNFTFAWLFAEAGRVEALVDLDRAEEAIRHARRALSCCRRSGVIALGQALVRALALAEAKLGHCRIAADLLDSAIESARTREVTGLQLGSLYEARTYVAIEARDSQAVEHYARLTAHEYGYGHGSSLGARCERLLEAAALREAAPSRSTHSEWGASLQGARSDLCTQLAAEVCHAMAGAEAAEGRAQRALRLLCESHGASAGHLYLADGPDLRIAASYETSAPEPSLAELTAKHLAFDLQQRADVTRVDGEAQPRLGADPRVLWHDADGTCFEPRILHCMVAGEARCAGIAWLARHHAPQRSTRPAQYINALSTYLVELQETSGV